MNTHWPLTPDLYLCVTALAYPTVRIRLKVVAKKKTDQKAEFVLVHRPTTGSSITPVRVFVAVMVLNWFSCQITDQRQCSRSVQSFDRPPHHCLSACIRFVVGTLELMVAENYVIVYLCAGGQKDKLPGISWLRECYTTIDRR